MSSSYNLSPEQRACVRRIRANPDIQPGAELEAFKLVPAPLFDITTITMDEWKRQTQEARALQQVVPSLAEAGLLRYISEHESDVYWAVYRVLPELWEVELDD